MFGDSRNLSNVHNNRIWARGSVFLILLESFRTFQATYPKDPVAALVKRASDRVSIVKRFKGLFRPIGFLFGFMALRDVQRADRLGLQTAEQVDVVSNVLSKTPRRFSGKNVHRAFDLVLSAFERFPKMIPHTRALLLVTRAEIESGLHEGAEVKEHYLEALKIEPLIEDDRQRVRVLRKAAFFFLYNYRSHEESMKANDLYQRAIRLAEAVAPDQAIEMKFAYHEYVEHQNR